MKREKRQKQLEGREKTSSGKAEARSKAGKAGRSGTMKSILKLFSKKQLVLTFTTVAILIIAWIQIADAPPFESLTLDDVSCYQIDIGGRIIDSDGRLRGWIRDSEVYSPGLEIKYRLSGNQLEGSN